MVKVLVLFVVFLFIFIFSNLNSIQHRVLKRKMYSNIKKIKDNGEFESIYNQIMSNINIEDVKKVVPVYGKFLGATCDVLHCCNEGKESCGRIKGDNNER